MAGFSDRAANALANAARNRLERRHNTGETFDAMLSGEMTEDQEERTRLSIRTFTRTNDMLASTIEYVNQIDVRLSSADATVGEMRVWVGLLERAAKVLDPREAVILAAVEAVEDTDVNLSVTDAIPGGGSGGAVQPYGSRAG